MDYAFDLRLSVLPIVRLPDWGRSEYFSIAAKAEDGVILNRDTLRPRMRRFLEERFKLVAHIETRNAKGYALVVAQGGPKLKASTKPPVQRTAIAGDRLINPSGTMDALAESLQALLNRKTRDGLPVVNETGLAGNFDVALSFSPESAIDSPFPSLFTALQDQLGLRLISREGIPVPVLVIDHVEYPTLDQ